MKELILNEEVSTFIDNKGKIHCQMIGGNESILDGVSMDYILCTGFAFDSDESGFTDIAQGKRITCPKCITKLKRFQKELNKLF